MPLTAALTSDGQPVANASVRLQDFVAGDWQDLGSPVVTNAKGRSRFMVTVPRTDTKYRATFAGSSAVGAAKSEVVVIVPVDDPTITASSRPTAPVGASVPITANLVDESGSPVANGYVTFVRLTAEGSSRSASHYRPKRAGVVVSTDPCRPGP